MSSNNLVPEVEYLGNKDLLELYKIGFLCSRKVLAEIILKTYDWAIDQREKRNCIMSGFHSKIEKNYTSIIFQTK